MKPTSASPTLFTEDSVLALVKICEEIGPNFKIFARHIMKVGLSSSCMLLFKGRLYNDLKFHLTSLKGGSTSISSDDLNFKEKCVGALQYLVPIQTTKSFLIHEHTLQAASQPYLLISPKGQKITCILNNCDEQTKRKLCLFISTIYMTL